MFIHVETAERSRVHVFSLPIFTARRYAERGIAMANRLSVHISVTLIKSRGIVTTSVKILGKYFTVLA